MTTSPPATADLIEALIRFDGPPADFLRKLIATQCAVAAAEAGAMMRPGRDGVELLAAHPRIDPARAPAWLSQAMALATEAMRAGRTQVLPLRSPDELYGAEAARHLITLPMRAGTDVRGVAAFVVEHPTAAQRAEAVDRLELTSSLLAIYELRLTLSARAASLGWLKQACAVLWEVNGHRRFRAAGMALCNQVASVWDAERVSLGMARGRYVKLAAQSHTEKFTRKTELVQALEAAMEESFDQDAEVLHPCTPEATTIARAAGELCKRFGPCSILSLPLRHGDKVVGVLTAERAPDRSFETEEVEALRLACNLCTARVVEMYERDRWIGARAVAATKRAAGWAVGPTHTWVKLLAVALLALACVMAFVTGTYRIEAPFVIEAHTRHVVAAPFAATVIDARVEVGDSVRAGDTLIVLDTLPLQQELAERLAERAAYDTEARIARRESKIADEQVALAQVRRLDARLDLLRWQIDQATIVAPIDGQIVSGDWKRQVDAPIDTGDALYEIARLDDLRARLAVPERRVGAVAVGLEGELAAVANPRLRHRFRVERISPVAEVVDQRNVFPVRARLLDETGLRPGMEGLAKIDAGERRLGWIWTKEVVDWARMKLWW